MNFVEKFNIENDTIYVKENLPPALVCIGDSYIANNPTNNWSTWLKTYMDVSDDNFYVDSEGSTGFAATVNGRNFVTMITTIPVADPSSVTHVVVCGGINDGNSSDMEILTGIMNFCNTARTRFPNAKIYVGFISWMRHSNVSILFWQKQQIYAQAPAFGGAMYLNGCEYVMQNKAYILPDNVHPTTVASQKLGNAIAEAIRTGYVKFPMLRVNHSIFSNDDGTGTNLGQILANFYGDGYVEIQSQEKTFTGNFQFTEKFGFDLGYLHPNQGFLQGNQDFYLALPCLYVCKNAEEQEETFVGALLIYYNKVHPYIQYRLGDSTGIFNATSFKVDIFSRTFPVSTAC